MQQKINTISCPCSSYAITNTNGTVSCERDNFGKIEYVAPVVLQNHLINGSAPAVGDKWSCGGAIKCGSTGFSWNTLHVVSVSENHNESNSSLVNTTSSTSNCYVPKSSLRDYETGEELSGWDSYTKKIQAIVSYNTNIIKTVDGMPFFDNEEAAQLYDNSKFGKNTREVSSYYDDGELMFAPGKYYKDTSLITRVTVNGKNILKTAIKSDFRHQTSEASSNKIVIPSKGGVIEIKIDGENAPTIDILVNDSSGCSVFKRKIKNEPITKGYTIRQVIPALPKGASKETYSIKITPKAGVKYYLYGEGNAEPITNVGILEYKVWQYKEPTFTFNANSSTIAGSATTSTAKNIVGVVNKNSENIDGFKPIVHTTTITNSGENNNTFYNLKDKLVLSDLISDSSVIKKAITNSPTSKECMDLIEIVDSVDTNVGDIEVGMQFTGFYEETKILQRSIDLDPTKEPCDNCDRDLEVLTNKFELENTTELVEGMSVSFIDAYGDNVVSQVESVDSNVAITLAQHYVINEKTSIKFTYRNGGYVGEIVGNSIRTYSCMWLPKNTELVFTKGNNTGIRGSVVVDKSGSGSMVITTTIKNINFGQEDVNFVLDVNEFVSNTPNAKDVTVESPKNDSVVVDYLKNDNDYNFGAKSVEVVRAPKNGVLDTISNTVVHYYPNEGFVGRDEIVFRSFTGSGEGKVYSEEKIVSIIVK
tara:strand:- start:265 stop:2376 length:2112 start_codon:yes stop_codon:yes gene_type:complete